ncbi:MAG: peptide chain release factor N(5)-glutamine methyltransferase [Spirochaetaceae bacterium]|nr:peptide chain release factor N(5)-glutamine methyltransferase [Spirochaetaceae bacterium]
MKIKDALMQASYKISKKWKDTPLLDAQVILQKIMGMTKEMLIASYNCDIHENILESFNMMVEKRVSGYPVAYITGEKEFFGRSFYVNENTLIPRRDTETIIETVLEESEKLIKETDLLSIKILDLCTGSGCIAIILKSELGEKADVEASDISSETENIFYKNCENILGKKLLFHKSDLFNSITNRYHIIVSNPPYLKNIYVDEMVSNNWPEPEISLRGGNDGLDYIREIIEASVKHLEKGGLLCMEADPDQMDIIRELLIKNNFEYISIKKDLAQKERVIGGYYPGNFN